MNRDEWEDAKHYLVGGIIEVDEYFAAGGVIPDVVVERQGNVAYRVKPEGTLWDTRFGRGRTL